MNWKKEWKPLALIVGAFLVCFYLPVEKVVAHNAFIEALRLVRWYAREHVVLCLIPAFFIAGAISVFLSQAAVMKYLGAEANKVVAYGVASVSGTILAVCSCTVLPLFAGIHRMGAGLGPACAFLYSGPAINALAIILTARVLGVQLGAARAIGAVAFSVVIGLLMALIFRKEERARIASQTAARSAALSAMTDAPAARSLAQTALYFAAMVAILVFANWGAPGEAKGVWHAIYAAKWILTALAGTLFAVMLVLWFALAWWKAALVWGATAVCGLLLPHEPLAAFSVAAIGLSIVTATDKGETGEWFAASWGFAKQIAPLLLIGVFASGLLLGFPGREDAEGLIPSAWVERGVGGNSLGANLFASVAGAFMYFATLTEVPILAGLLGANMGQGPALALLLAGPALSLPSMLVIRGVMGTKKTVVYVALVIVMATITGLIYGAVFWGNGA